MQFSVSFDVTWYVEAAIYTKKSSFLSFHSLLFLVNRRREVIEWNWQSVTLANENKNIITKVTSKWRHGWFVVLLSYFYTLRKSDFLGEISPQSYSWSLNCLERFSVLMLLMDVSKCWKIVWFSKISIKMKDFDNILRCSNTELP